MLPSSAVSYVVIDALPPHPSFKQYRTEYDSSYVNQVGSEPQSYDFCLTDRFDPSKDNTFSEWSLYEVAKRLIAEAEDASRIAATLRDVIVSMDGGCE
jgi:hypothetical protein